MIRDEPRPLPWRGLGGALGVLWLLLWRVVGWVIFASADATQCVAPVVECRFHDFCDGAGNGECYAEDF